MEGWVEFTDAKSGLKFQHHWGVIHRIDQREDGNAAIMYTLDSGIQVKESYDEVVLRISNAVERERDFGRKFVVGYDPGIQQLINPT